MDKSIGGFRCSGESPFTLIQPFFFLTQRIIVNIQNGRLFVGSQKTIGGTNNNRVLIGIRKTMDAPKNSRALFVD